MARICECGSPNNIDHALTCKLGGFVIMRHNTVRDVEADFLRTICKDVSVEPGLIPLTGNEGLPRGSNIEDNARLDVACRGFWAPLQKMFLDIRLTHPNAPSNRSRQLKSLLMPHEHRKKVEYNERVLQVEHASFAPLVFATNGAMGEEAQRYHSILADRLSDKMNCTYADTMNYIRKKLSFTILQTALIALRGHRRKQTYTASSIRDVDVNIICHN